MANSIGPSTGNPLDRFSEASPNDHHAGQARAATSSTHQRRRPRQ
ncbi:hypothetical protein [Actinophytocola sp.]